jgi:hypothetical protein
MPTKDIKQLSCFPIPGAYTCIINEAQRAYIARVLRERTVSHPAEFRDNIETEYLVACLDRLPEDEAQHPGVHHGLCL